MSWKSWSSPSPWPSPGAIRSELPSAEPPLTPWVATAKNLAPDRAIQSSVMEVDDPDPSSAGTERAVVVLGLRPLLRRVLI